MKYRIVWSKFAQFQLDVIFNYYAERVSSSLAKKIMRQIRDDVSQLEINPFIRKREELLSHRTQDYRLLIVNNYKVVYTVDQQDGIVKVSDVFDTRQNPKKLKRN